jgi:pSer/pThr/pTyr-binding forkhead associated (FHA) protein
MQLDLVFLQNNTETSRVTLSAGEFVIGRDSACEIVVVSDEVSRRHARLTVNDSNLFIEDLGSAKGAFINGHRAKGRAPLGPGQRVHLGTIAFEARW